MVSAPKGAVRWVMVRDKKSQPISRVLSWTAIHLGLGSLLSLKQPTREPYGPHVRVAPLAPLFGLAPSGVYRAADGYPPRGALLPHLFTLAGACALRRYVLCGTFRGLAPPRRYLALRPMEPGLSSMLAHCDCLADSGDHYTWPGGLIFCRRVQGPADRGGSCSGR